MVFSKDAGLLSNSGSESRQDFYSISQICKQTGIAAHTLRYWESEFNLLRPNRKISGHRKYNRQDLALILKIKDLLQTQGLTIAGAKRFLLEEKRQNRQPAQLEIPQSGLAANEILRITKQNLQEILDLLR